MDRKERHILFLSSWYPNRNAPTLGNFVQKHAEAAALYNQVTAFSVFSSEEVNQITMDESFVNGVNTLVVYYPKVKTSLPFYAQLLKFFRLQKAFYKGWKHIIKKYGTPDLTHLNVVLPIGIFAARLQRKYKIPFIVTEHSTAYHEGSNKLTPAERKIAVSVMNKASRLIPVSKDLDNSLRRAGVKTPSVIIPNVVNEAIFSQFSIKTPLIPQFLHISTAVDEHKNVSGIIRTVSRMYKDGLSFSFKIISDGNLHPHRQLAKDLEIPENVLVFEGTKTTQEIAAEISRSTALVLFSNYENFPCVIPEAFMLGVPVISTAVNGIPEHVNATNGVLIPPKDEEALYTAMNDFILKKLTFPSDTLKEHALQHFSYSAVGKKLDEIYKEVIAEYVS